MYQQNPYAGQESPPSFLGFYFSPSGRVSRGQYWMKYLLPCGALGLIGIFILIACVLSVLHHRMQPHILWIILAILGVKFVLLTWVSFVMHMKRYHDFNMSWFTATMIDDFVPMGLGRDWMLFRILFEEGTQGPNNFGPDPRMWG